METNLFTLQAIKCGDGVCKDIKTLDPHKVCWLKKGEK